jgi:hypothetical protein
MVRKRVVPRKIIPETEDRPSPKVASPKPKMAPSPVSSPAVVDRSPAVVGKSPAGVDRSLVNEAVKFINEKANETMYRGSQEIGAYLLKKFFHDDIKLASSRRPHKSASYTALCQREDLAVHPATLSLMVRVAAQEIFFKTSNFNSAGLSYTHKAELVKLPNTADKIRLAQRALKGNISTRLLSEEVKKVQAKFGNKEEVVPSVEKYMMDPVRLFENPRASDFISNTENLKKMRPITRRKLHEKALKMIDKTRDWAKRYQKLADELKKLL